MKKIGATPLFLMIFVFLSISAITTSTPLAFSLTNESTLPTLLPQPNDILTHVSDYVRFFDSITISNPLPVFKGQIQNEISDSNYVLVEIDGVQVGNDTNISTVDGTWSKNWNGPPLDDDTYYLTIKNINGTIIYSANLIIDADGDGNIGDTTPPVITVPDEINIEATGILTWANLSATVSDDADPSPVLTNNAPQYLPLGNTTVTWTAIDIDGNQANKTSP